MVSAVLDFLEQQIYNMADMLCCEHASAEQLFQRVPVKMDFRLVLVSFVASILIDSLGLLCSQFAVFSSESRTKCDC